MQGVASTGLDYRTVPEEEWISDKGWDLVLRKNRSPCKYMPYLILSARYLLGLTSSSEPTKRLSWQEKVWPENQTCMLPTSSGSSIHAAFHMIGSAISALEVDMIMH